MGLADQFRLPVHLECMLENTRVGSPAHNLYTELFGKMDDIVNKRAKPDPELIKMFQIIEHTFECGRHYQFFNGSKNMETLPFNDQYVTRGYTDADRKVLEQMERLRRVETHPCSMCQYVMAYVYDPKKDRLFYDAGCHCTNRVPNLEPRNPDALLESVKNNPDDMLPKLNLVGLSFLPPDEQAPA